MKKTYISSCYFKHNYGSALQAYATQRYLDLIGVPNETFDVSHLKDFKSGKRRYYFHQLLNFSFYRAKFGMIKFLFRKKFSKKLKANILQREKAFLEFERMNFRLTPAMSSYKQLHDFCLANASNVIVGSDQLWLPVNVVADYYTLNFVPQEINTIAYATSFGVSKIPGNLKDRYKRFLNRIQHLSVREESGKNIISALTDKQCEVVCDPTLLLTEQEWTAISSKTPIVEEKYIFCYFLGKDKAHRQFAERLKSLTGYKIVSINHCDEFVKYSDKFADEAPYNVGPSEWLNLLHNAEFVCTDSFHGTVFSLIFRRKFFSFRRYSKKSSFSTNSRLDTLLKMAGAEGRIFSGKESEDEIKKLIAEELPYDAIGKRLEEYRAKSKEYIIRSVKIEKQDTPYIKVEDKTDCCGCTACASICPKNCITMQEDAEGFRYPVVDPFGCIGCGACKRVCPIANKKPEKMCPQRAFLVQNKDDKILSESTSGGAFTAFAEDILRTGGVVVGASFDKDLEVCHIAVTEPQELYRFRNSKYVQSNLTDIFAQTKRFLQEGRRVLFSGTPCQIEGFKAFLQKDYANLYTIDVVCRACPSPLIWRKYREFRSEDSIKYQIAKFRDKSDYGYEYSQISLSNRDRRIHFGVESDPYLRAFFGNLSDRPSCYKCAFKKQYRESDITIWDCFDVYKFDKGFDDNRGVTRVLVHSEKGEYLVRQAENKCKIKEINVDDAVKGVREIVRSVPCNADRNQFFSDAARMEEEALFKKWFPDTIKVKMERFVRHTSEKLGIYAAIKKFAKKILRK